MIIILPNSYPTAFPPNVSILQPISQLKFPFPKPFLRVSMETFDFHGIIRGFTQTNRWMIYRVYKNATDKFRMVVGEVYGSARKIVPVVGVASRGGYGASKASPYPLVSRETIWHACRM